MIRALFTLFALQAGAVAAEHTEFRTAQVVGKAPALERVLGQQGFQILPEADPGAGMAHLPVNGFHLLYFRGESLDVEDLMKEIKTRHFARFCLVVIELQGDVDEPRQQLQRACRGLGKSNPGRLRMILNTAKAQPDDLERSLVAWLAEPSTGLPDLPEDVAWNYGKVEGPIVLRGAPAMAISPPDKLVTGRKAGDQWLAPDGMNFVWIPPGTFIMGDARFYDAQPLSVVVAAGFWMSKYEQLGFGKGHRLHPVKFSQADHAVELVKKREAPTGWSYDLPTEREWEYAARAGSTNAFPAPARDMGAWANFADRRLYEDREPVHYVFAHREVDDGASHGFTTVGRYRPNAWGLHDMLGNAAEFVAGFYREDVSVEPYETLTSSRERRPFVLRGGSWCTPLRHLNVAYRTRYNGDSTTAYAGTRLILRHGEPVARTIKDMVERSGGQ
ncbi:MAG: formylglycine-generating enzyme family protein [Verrucomicrobiota bacterium]